MEEAKTVGLLDPKGVIDMKPDLEVVSISSGESFTVWAHGYPFRTVRWHFHPEYEIQLIVETSGTCFVGDYIGDFVPNDLVMAGPNLPHNWISDVPEGVTVERRGIVIQFTQQFIETCLAVFPELTSVRRLLKESRRGVKFSEDCAALVRPLMVDLLNANGLRRICLLSQIFEVLCADATRRLLASDAYVPDPSVYLSRGMNRALAHVRDNLAEPLREEVLAEIAGLTSGGFSRAFKRHTGMTFVQYVNRLRINLACQLLMDRSLLVTNICYQVGFNNISNFNRHFFTERGMTPSRFRELWEQNRTMRPAA